MKKDIVFLFFILLLASTLFIRGSVYARDFNFFIEVPNLTTVSLYTVRDGKVFFLKDVVIANSNSSACNARIFRDGVEIFFAVVPAEGTFTHQFTNMRFKEGKELSVRNADCPGSIQFTITGEQKSFGQ